MLHHVKYLYSKIARALAYAKLGYNNPDWDYSSVEKYLEFKLKRIRNSMINGFVDYSEGEQKKQLQAITLTVRLLEKVNADSYDHYAKLHELKWEQSGLDFDQKLEREEFIEAYKKDRMHEHKHRSLVYNIIKKYITSWWN